MTQTTQTFASLATVTAADLMGSVHGTIRTGAALSEAVDRFLTGPTRHLVVLDDDGRCVGLIGPRHLAQAHRAYRHPDPNASIEVVGYAPWVFVSPGDSLGQCARMLVENDLDAVPVLDEELRVLGLVTAHDIARAAAEVAAA